MAEQYDVTIIGAGACGLMAARELAKAGKKVLVLEARDRIGGRIHTVTPGQFPYPVERGAEFVHGELPVTKRLVKEAHLTLQPAGGAIWEKRKGKWEEQDDFLNEDDHLRLAFQALDKEDQTVETFLDTHLPGPELEEKRQEIRQYVEGYYAADTRQASAQAFREEWQAQEEGQYRIREGYSALAHFLCQEIENAGGIVLLHHPVQQVHWKKDMVEIIAAQHTFHSQKLLLTIPLGIWQADAIRFNPAITHKVEAARNMGFGPVIKMVLLFSERFWTEGLRADWEEPWFIFTEETVPTYWTQFPDTSPLLTAWISGPRAHALKDMTDDQLLQAAVDSLGRAFEQDPGVIRRTLSAYQVVNWVTDPFSLGAYSYEVVNGATYRRELQAPVNDTLFFGGEALHEGPHIGTVEGALASGLEQAGQILEAFGRNNG